MNPAACLWDRDESGAEPAEPGTSPVTESLVSTYFSH
jgi:hypothetical protein